jgi:hypothetical protein
MLLEGAAFTVCWLYKGDQYPVADYLHDLYQADISSYASLVDAMKRLTNPTRLAPPHVRALKGKPYKGIFELRARIGAKGLAARIPLILNKQDVVLLFGVTKKSNQPTQQFLDKSVRYREMIINKEAGYEPIDFEAITALK